MKHPSSFCSMCTFKCSQELVGLLLSLSIHHPNSNIYLIVDSKTNEKILNMTPTPKLNLFIKVELDKYDGLNRSQMEKQNVWSDFQMVKANVISYALENEKDTLFLDSDILILDEIFIDETKELGLSPQFIKDKNVQEVGYYNGGVLWTNQKELPGKWIFYTKTSRYYDQASLEDLAKIYSFFEFGENYNLQTWRFIIGKEDTQKIISYLNIRDNKIYYKKNKLKFIHTHFNLPNFRQINNFFIQIMSKAKLYKELLIIYRIIYDKWIIQIPKQPLKGLWNHKNDSFRQLALLLKVKNNDLDLEINDKIKNCWLKPNICLYDRPTLEWIDNNIQKSTLFLLGNGDINKEGEILKEKLKLIVKPWIFWPRKPMVLEKVLRNNGILNYEDRTTNTIFIGNFENNVQKKYRKTNNNWEKVIDEYHCTAGQIHKFTNEEYLLKLRNAKYGLCLRGYGSKCHREVELMAFGTVPVITNEVSIDSYYDKPIENKHYIKISSSNELKDKINKISEEEWKKMSKNCYDWYQRNVHSDYCWKNMINNILYKF